MVHIAHLMEKVARLSWWHGENGENELDGGDGDDIFSW